MRAKPKRQSIFDMPDQTLLTPILMQDKPEEFLFTVEQPLTVSVSSNTALHQDETERICHIVLNHEGQFKFLEGQAIGVAVNGMVKYFNICSSQKGDTGYSNTISIFVKDECEITKHLCGVVQGSELQIAGPVGLGFIAPKDPSTNVIMIASGPGQDIFRSFLNRWYVEPAMKHLGQTRLFLEAEDLYHLFYSEELD